MEAIAHARHMRISARKIRLVVDLIRGQRVEDALVILQGTRKKASPMVEKALRSAIANALFVGEEDESTAFDRPSVDDLVVSKAWVNEGATMKRFRPRSMGRANRIRKRTSHLTIGVAPKPSRSGRS